MKRIETLLQRYAEGTITPEERDELDNLTRRHDIMSAAATQAQAIRRRRRTTLSAAAAVLIVVGVYFSFFNVGNPTTTDNTLIAKTDIPLTVGTPATDMAPTTERDATQLHPSHPEERITPTAHTPQPHKAANRPETSAPQAAAPVSPTPETEALARQSAPTATQPSSIAPQMAADPVVACNTQCSPDSVINDIWNFLKA